MAITPAAAADLRNALRAFRAAHTSLAVPSGAGKALEAWILIRLAMTARSLGWTVSLRRGDDTPLPPGHDFVFTAGGSGIGPSSAAAPMFVMIEDPQGKAYELHGSLVWIGRSGASHECDVSMLPRSVAMALRSRRRTGNPRGLPLLIIECKDKVGTGTLDEMRQMLARMFDLALVTKPSLGPCRIFSLGRCPTLWGRHSSQYRSLYRRGLFAVARASGFQPGASTLASHYAIVDLPQIYSSGQITQIEAKFSTLLSEVAGY
ncbi:hypothetical protein [Brevundimonas sp.]|uniref:hypothetical protein n=1 Tax=Brevundimonas sp. TaxID=1871086 RepID=UPI002D53CCE4|nr:hypothetical protein [Brevundimonas sp.]HYC66578.1 hypothetical protein [Brevundimonas sp.]